MSQTEAQKRAQKKYNESKKDRRNYLRRRGGARDLITKDKEVTLEDLEELEKLIEERKILLKEENENGN